MNKPAPQIRLRRFVSRRVVSSQLFPTMEAALKTGQAWTLQSGKNTVAYSDAKRPRV